MCLECASKIPCDACKKRYPRKEWPAKMLYNQKHSKCHIVCSSCRGKGCTPQDPNLYTCQRCHEELGTARFGKDLLHNFKCHDRQKLICLACTREDDARVSRLRRQFKASKVYCKCGCPIHRERCPLVPRYQGERRWPGCDADISAEDRTFLDDLRPKPDWWTRAWLKPAPRPTRKWWM